MDGRFAAPLIGVVETRQVVVDQRGAVDQFDGQRGLEGQLGMLHAAGLSNRKTQAGPDPRPSAEYCVLHGSTQQRRPLHSLCTHGGGKRRLDLRHDIQGVYPR